MGDNAQVPLVALPPFHVPVHCLKPFSFAPSLSQPAALSPAATKCSYETTERSSGYERREDEYERASAGVGEEGSSPRGGNLRAMRNACHLPPAPCPRLFRAAEVLYICSTPLPVPPSPGPTGVAGATAVPAMAYTERSGEVATGASAGDVSVTRQGAEEVCGREYFTKVCLGGAGACSRGARAGCFRGGCPLMSRRPHLQHSHLPLF